MAKYFLYTLIILYAVSCQNFDKTQPAQQSYIKEESLNGLYHYGFVDYFLEGNYDGSKSYEELLKNGGFGIAAPDALNGEVTFLDGVIYQTISNGKTFIPDNSDKASFAAITDFNSDAEFRVNTVSGKEQLEDLLLSEHISPNIIYGIKVTGNFKTIITRSFPKLKEKPFPALPAIMGNQKLFEYEKVEGVLVGFYSPKYLKIVNIPGFHFHFLSIDKEKGGHVLEVEIESAIVQISKIENYSVEIPIEEQSFKSFDFDIDRSQKARKAEGGME